MPFSIRPAEPKDLDALAKMGAELARQHHAFDPSRFMLPAGAEEGYRWWLGKELRAKDAVVLVADDGAAAVGYAYGRLEERDWNALRDACGGFHDLWVEPSARGRGVGGQLAEALFRRLVALGAPRVVLMSASPNVSAQALFRKLGFRPTMVEMTREA